MTQGPGRFALGRVESRCPRKTRLQLYSTWQASESFYTVWAPGSEETTDRISRRLFIADKSLLGQAEGQSALQGHGVIGDRHHFDAGRLFADVTTAHPPVNFFKSSGVLTFANHVSS